MSRVLVLVVLGLSSFAHAEAKRSPEAAFALSGATTLGGFALTWYGSTLNGDAEGQVVTAGLITATVGPTLGNIYAGDIWNAGLAVRLISAGTGLVGFAMIVRSDCLIECNGSRALAEAGGLVVIGSGFAYLAGTFAEIVNAPAAVHRRNLRRIVVTPTIAREGAGVTLGGSF